MGYDGEDHEAIVDAKGRDPDVGEHTYRFPDGMKLAKLPAVVRVAWRRGALGFAWQSRPAQLDCEGTVFVEG